MMSLFLWSQLVVSLALLLDLLSFQLRDRRRILACLALSCALNAGHFALLGQWSAASLLLLASMRFLVSIWLVRRILMWFFMGLACAAALATYQGLLSWIGLLASQLQTRPRFALMIACCGAGCCSVPSAGWVTTCWWAHRSPR